MRISIITGLFFIFLTVVSCVNSGDKKPGETVYSNSISHSQPSVIPDCNPVPLSEACRITTCDNEACADSVVLSHRICENTFETMLTPGMTDTRSYPAVELRNRTNGVDCKNAYVEISDDLEFIIHSGNKGIETAFYNFPLFTQLLKQSPDSIVFYKTRRPNTPENPVNAIFKVWDAGVVTGYYDLSTHQPPSTIKKTN